MSKKVKNEPPNVRQFVTYSFMVRKDRTGASRLLSLGSLNGTYACASAAIDAVVCIDNILAVALCDAAYGTFVCASTACDAIIGNLICHSKHLRI